MTLTRYELTAAQAAFLEAQQASGVRPRGCYRDESFESATARTLPSHSTFSGPLPPVVDQSVRGTCVASAVAALVACYEGCRRRISVQYLDEVTRLAEQAWISRNIQRLAKGESVKKDFEAAFPDAVAQAVLLVRANGAGSENALAFMHALETKIRTRVEADAGCRLRRCFDALEEYGVCREELWPYTPISLRTGAVGGDAMGAFPPGTHEDARRHRIVNGLYLLRAPNNVSEIRGIIAGAQGRRPMPVCVGLELFEGLTDGEFLLPDVVREDGRTYAAQRTIGIHEVLIVAYTDDAKIPGGGFFTIQNSWGATWGEGGQGRVSYAYVACFCREAGTILQEPDDYGPGAAPQTMEATAIVTRRRLTMICAVCICLTAAVISVGITLWSLHASSATPVAPILQTQSTPQKIPTANQTNMEDQPRGHVRDIRQKIDTKHAVNAKVAKIGHDGDSKTPKNESDDDFGVVRVIDYRFRVRGFCDSTVEARDMAYALDGEHREFSFEDMQLTSDKHGFEGEITIEGFAGRPPDVIRTIESYLKRKKIESSVRNWAVRRLHKQQNKSNNPKNNERKKHE